MQALNDAVSAATKAVSFERIVISGMFGLVVLDMALSFVLAAFYPSNDATQFVLSALKDIMLMSVGALVANLRHKPNSVEATQ